MKDLALIIILGIGQGTTPSPGYPGTFIGKVSVTQEVLKSETAAFQVTFEHKSFLDVPNDTGGNSVFLEFKRVFK
jgi:hypothetical protein